MSDNNGYGEPIYRYTRKQAIEDGMLMDVSKLGLEAGFKYPIAISAALWHTAVDCSEQDERNGQSETGRIWDILNVLRFEISRLKNDSSRLDFKVSVYKDGRPEDVQMYALCGPGDNAEPVFTIMLPNED